MIETLPLPVEVYGTGESDSAFVAFASPEIRSLGVARRFSGYTTHKVCILRITDENNPKREECAAELRRLSASVGPVADIETKHGDPISGMEELAQTVDSACDEFGVITVDISTFPKNALLLVLRTLTRLDKVKHIRILYTEPGAYESWLGEPTSYGLRRVGVVPTFAASYRGGRELVLITLLGFERDRTLGLWQSIEPHRTIAVIADPPYHPEWSGTAERLNAALLSGLADTDVLYVDPRNPVATYELLRRLIPANATALQNYYIAPLGTKPQTVGVHYFCSERPEAASVAYASPLEPNKEYMAAGSGRTWLLPRPGGHK